MFCFSHFLFLLHTLHNLGHRNSIEMKSQVQTVNINTVFFQDVKLKDILQTVPVTSRFCTFQPLLYLHN